MAEIMGSFAVGFSERFTIAIFTGQKERSSLQEKLTEIHYMASPGEIPPGRNRHSEVPTS